MLILQDLAGWRHKKRQMVKRHTISYMIRALMPSYRDAYLCIAVSTFGQRQICRNLAIATLSDMAARQGGKWEGLNRF
jgi:hypothetical protein